jgi:hypothetical protein
MELAACEGKDVSLPNKNAANWKIWWGVPGRILAAVLDHITVAKNRQLTYPQTPRRWTPR